MDKWLDENIEKIDFEDLMELDRKVKQNLYWTACSFGAGIIIQQWVVKNPEFLSESKGIARGLKGGFWTLFPFIACYFGYSSSLKRRDRYARMLMDKYEHIGPDFEELKEENTQENPENTKPK